MKPPRSRWHEFFEGANGAFNAFTLISLLAGFTLVSAPLVCRLLDWAPLSRDEIGSLTLLYCISALGDTLLGVFLNKLPGTINLDTGGGPANLAAGAGAAAEQEA